MINWHWEAMLISYLSKRVTTLPFNNIPELLENTDFRIALLPGAYEEDVFKYATDHHWKRAWKERIEPFIPEYNYKGISEENMIQLPAADPSIALYFITSLARSINFHVCRICILNNHDILQALS